jgi:hypothetical protein
VISIVRLRFERHYKEAKMSKINNCGRREFLKNSVAAVFAASYWGWPTGAVTAEDGPGLHGMLIVGEQTVFLSHLPTFESPHDYQVLLEAAFAKPGSDPQADYFNDRKGKGKSTKIYTLEPDPFVLPRLAAAMPERSFKANVYRGHFEKFPSQRAKEGAQIAQNADVKVTRVIHFRKYDLTAAKPARLEYLLFGKGTELFLAHLITKPPDFDQILAVKITGHEFTNEELAKGVAVVFPGTTNAAASRLKEKQRLTGEMKVDNVPAPKKIQVEVNREFYFEEGELRLPPDFHTTSAEKQAGFP